MSVTNIIACYQMYCSLHVNGLILDNLLSSY